MENDVQGDSTVAYKFQIESTISDNVQRIISEQIAKARSALTEEEDRQEGVHAARKCFKKARGALRLVRPALGDVYQQENRRFRDAGRMLSDIRDAEALVETVDKLCAETQEHADTERFRGLRAALVERSQQFVSNHSDLELRVEAVLENLDAAQGAMESWPALPEEFDTVGAGLKKTYKRGRNAMQSAYDEPSTEAFHNWRKRVKYSWYHARLLKDVWSPVMKSYRDELKYLSDLLGDDHDFAVLCETLDAQPELLSHEQDRRALAALVQQQQEQVRNEAWLMGQRLYALRPRAIVQSVEQSWHMWKQKAKQEQAA
jgi:CHAD domain-containing protein